MCSGDKKKLFPACSPGEERVMFAKNMREVEKLVFQSCRNGIGSV